MKFKCPLIVVDSIKDSRIFYEEFLGQRVIADYGENIVFEGDFALQSKTSWQKFIERHPVDIRTCSNGAELYFEEDHFDQFIKRLSTFESIEYLHDVKTYDWGQRVIRFYDPDGHIIEVGESMEQVVIGFLEKGMTLEETMKYSQMSEEFVRACQKKIGIDTLADAVDEPEK